MRTLFSFTLLLALGLLNCGGQNTVVTEPNENASTLYEQGFQLNSLMEEPVNLEQYKGKVVLIVNTASKCGLTPQYEGLERLYGNYADKGLVILGFPANNFLSQEPGSNSEIAEFCQKNYGVSFPMFSKISVKGKDQHELYQWLTQAEKNGVMDAGVEWNFKKFLLDKDGKLVAEFSPRTEPEDPEITGLIEKLL